MTEKTNINLNFSWFGALGLVLIILKLCGVIDWRWLWVLAPIWIPALVVGGIIAVLLIVKAVLNKRGW